MASSLRLRLIFLACVSAPAALFNASIAAAQEQQEPQVPPPTEMGRIYGRVINPAGVPQKGGTVSLSVDGGDTLSYSFPVSPEGKYSGSAPPGEYTIVYRAPDTPEGKIADYISGVQVVAGQDTAQDIDMTRQEFVSRLSPEQQKMLQDLREANTAAASDAKRTASTIDADLQIVNLDLQAAGKARVTAAQNLGSAAARVDLDSMTSEIENAKLTEIETLMTKDAAADPSEPVVWIDLGRAEAGLRNYLDAEPNFKKGLDLALKEEPQRPQVVAAAQAGLGNVYAHTLLVDDANAAFDAAAKADPSNASKYLLSQAIAFFNAKNFDAEADAAETALKADPTSAILYYIKADGLYANARVDPDTNKLVLPPGCADAYRKYLELDPNGPYAANAATILQRAGEDTTAPTPTPQK